MLKNASPRQIASLISLLIAAGGSLLLLILFWFDRRLDFSWTTLLFLPALWLIAYQISLIYINKYIYRKVKLIYKTIHQHKVSSQEKTSPVDPDAHVLEDVEKEVNEWVERQEDEIERFKSWAEYRRKFVGDISHELKTPIFNIQGYLHSLLDGGLEDNAVNMTFLQKAIKNVERLHTIVEDLSAISRLESGELILEMQVFDIKELAEEVMEDLEIKARNKGISLEFKEGANQNFRVRADRESIRQVLTNLFHNSIKYGKAGGRTKVGFYDMDRYILAEVADNGIGIAAKHLPHVFDRFYRADKSRSRAQGGSGLGLSIVKHILEAHKQTINVRSTPDLGSTFGFTLEKA